MDMDTTLETDIKTFRGRTLEELLPKIRAELGPDAIVLRRREGLAGGVAGFFQRPYVEVDARSALPDETPLEARNDRATAEGLASPAIQALVDQAAPFADALARAESTVGERAHEVLIAAATAAAPADAGLYGPQPNHAAIVQGGEAPASSARQTNPGIEASGIGNQAAGVDNRRIATAGSPIVQAGRTVPGDVSGDDDDLFEAGDDDLVAPTAGEPAGREGLGAVRPATADVAERRLVAAGLSAALAADVVREAVAHGLPFAQPRALKKLVRRALARRMPVMADLGGEPRTIAFVGAGGAGKTSAAEHLATAYARADAEVTVVALRSDDGGTGLASRLEPLGVSVIAADDPEQAARRVSRRQASLTIVDTPAVGLGNPAAITRLAGDMRTLGVGEVHLALPATLSAVAADELAAALAPLAVTHVALTHADQTARPGAPVELAVTGRHALSYVCTRQEIVPADPDDLAKQLLP
jgi:flagellar biosynthesis GTPase FlhF